MLTYALESNPMKLHRRSFVFVSLTLLLPLSAVAQAAPDFAGARRFVKSKQDALQLGMRNAKDPKSDPALLAIFDGMLDYPHFVRHSLGTHWDSLSEAQRDHFGKVLRGLIRGSYRRNLRDISGYDVEYTGESEGEDGVIVGTRAADPRKKRPDPLRIDYVVAKTESGFKVRDIVTGGVSLVTNYRRQFGRIIRKKGFDELMRMMEKQLTKLESDETSPDGNPAK